MAETAEVVMVGAGVMGASIAFHLAERGAGRVLVLDQAFVAAGASGSSSGLVRGAPIRSADDYEIDRLAFDAIGRDPPPPSRLDEEVAG